MGKPFDPEAKSTCVWRWGFHKYSNQEMDSQREKCKINMPRVMGRAVTPDKDLRANTVSIKYTAIPHIYKYSMYRIPSQVKSLCFSEMLMKKVKFTTPTLWRN